MDAVIYGHVPSKKNVKDYASICGFDTKSEFLPITYPHVAAFKLHMELMLHRTFPLGIMGMVHVANKITQHRGIKLGEALDVRAFFAGSNRTHKGLDFRSRPAGMVYSAAPGTIREAKRSPSFGNTILIDHGQGVFTRYAHLANIEAGVEAGRDIGFGQPLGIMGTTGRSTGIHLHFEVLTGSYPSSLTAYNPLSFPPYIGLTAAY